MPAASGSVDRSRTRGRRRSTLSWCRPDRRRSRPVPHAMTADPRRSSALPSRTQSLMSRTMSMSCSTNSTVMPSSRSAFTWPSRRLLQRRVHPGHRLVEHDQLRVDHQRAGHLQQLALAAGQRCRRSRRACASSLNRSSSVVGAPSVLLSPGRASRPGTAPAGSSRRAARWRRAACSRCTVSRVSALVSWKVRTMPHAGDLGTPARLDVCGR